MGRMNFLPILQDFVPYWGHCTTQDLKVYQKSHHSKMFLGLFDAIELVSAFYFNPTNFDKIVVVFAQQTLIWQLRCQV